MSTKIYNAYKLVAGDSDHLYKDLNIIRKEYKELVKEFLKKQMPFFKEKGFVKVDSSGNYDISNLESLLREQENKHSMYNFNSSIIIYTYKRKFYIQFFRSEHIDPENTPHFKDLKSRGCYIDYHYQNQTDPWFYDEDRYTEEDYPELEKEYEEREKIWDELLRDSSVPSKAGWIKELKPEIYELDLYELAKE